ncbi:hypothetical protein KL86DYS2_10203 [uncultured Dysgonomonas sp.]|uniref:Uncharacterized protein n=1 Tax=uncultured Dysgonomonas sp. TaxID=206096 RepID=A0A212IWL3_9BACT|nr:hypothetical protein KL86DYS2_10203 [uncultured Dysgonomonas sp.]
MHTFRRANIIFYSLQIIINIKKLEIKQICKSVDNSFILYADKHVLASMYY